MIRDKMQPATAWRTIHCRVKVYVLIWDNSPVNNWQPWYSLSSIRELGTSELSSKGESSVYKAKFWCLTGNMPNWDFVDYSLAY